MKSLEIHLPYFKQGDDLNFCFDGTRTNEEALEKHAEMLKSASEQLLKIRDVIRGHKVEIDADTHHIGIYGEDEVMDKLLELELAYEYDDDDDDDDDDEGEEDDEE